MSESLSSALRLPRRILEDLPGGADESVHNKLRVFLEKRQSEALEREPVEHSKRTAEFLMYGYGGKKGVRLVDKILDVDLHRPLSKPQPSWRDDHTDLLNRLANDTQNETGRVSYYAAGGRVKHFTLNDRKRLASSLGTQPRDLMELLFYDDELSSIDAEEKSTDKKRKKSLLDMIWGDKSDTLK